VTDSDAGERPAALVVGVYRFGAGLDDLPVNVPVADLAEALRRCQVRVMPVADPDVHQLRECLDEAVDGQVDVVHVVSHGVWDGRTGRLQVAGMGAAGPDDYRRWVDVRSWLADVVGQDGPPLLVMLDVCSAGAAASHGWLDGDRRTVWVLGASEPSQNAYAARFTRAAATVFARVAAGDSLSTDASLEYLSLDLLATAIWDELAALCRADGGLPQRLAASSQRLGRRVPVALFRNPRFVDDPVLRARRELDQVLVASLDGLDPVLGGRHYRSRGAGATPDLHVLRCAFIGRETELSMLSSWLNRGRWR
jgi:hypothetical protein